MSLPKDEPTPLISWFDKLTMRIPFFILSVPKDEPGPRPAGQPLVAG